MKKIILVLLAIFTVQAYSASPGGQVARIYIDDNIVNFRLKDDACKSVPNK